MELLGVGRCSLVAGQMFGINTAADVANLVAKAFSGNSMTNVPNLISYAQSGFQGLRQNNGADEQEEDQSEQQSETENVQEEPPVENTTRKPPPITFDSGQMLSNMLRMVGFDTRKIGALALNALIMVAQAVSSYHSQSCFNLNPLMFFFRLVAPCCRLLGEVEHL